MKVSPWAPPEREVVEVRDQTKSIKRRALFATVALGLCGFFALSAASSAYDQWSVAAHDDEVSEVAPLFLLSPLVFLAPLALVAWGLWINAVSARNGGRFSPSAATILSVALPVLPITGPLVVFELTRVPPSSGAVVDRLLLVAGCAAAVGLGASTLWVFVLADGPSYAGVGLAAASIWAGALSGIGLVHRLSKET